MPLKIEDLIFWILIIAVIGVAIWLLSGSPTLESSLVSIALFMAGSEVLIWKSLFKIDKNTVVSFANFKNDLSNKHKELNDKLTKIEALVRNKK